MDDHKDELIFFSFWDCMGILVYNIFHPGCIRATMPLNFRVLGHHPEVVQATVSVDLRVLSHFFGVSGDPMALFIILGISRPFCQGYLGHCLWI